MDPRGVGPVTVKLNHTAAQLLARLCVELGTDDAVGVMSRALGLLDMAVHARRRGDRLCFIDHRGNAADVVF